MAINSTRSFIYDLSFPPSLNNMFPTDAHGKRFRSDAYDIWRRAALWELKQQRARPIIGQVEIIITLPDNTRKYDPDNRVKPLFDVLKEAGVIADDNHKIIRRHTVQIGDAPTGARVEITSIPGDEWVQRRDLAKKAAA